MSTLGPKTAILGPQFCRILVLGPHFWWSGGPPGSAPVEISYYTHFCIYALPTHTIIIQDCLQAPQDLILSAKKKLKN